MTFDRVVFVCALALCACARPREAESPLFGKWTSPLGQLHPLAGLVWDDGQRRFVTDEDLFRAIESATFIGVGEQHDNADHHTIQSRLIERFASTGRKPGVVFEMLDRDEETEIGRAVAAHPRDPDAVAAAVDWAHSGWPSWSIYRPVFLTTATRDLPILAGGIDRKAAMRLVAAGTGAAPPELVRDYGLDTPPSAPALESLRAEMRDAHCGLLPDSMLDGMVLVQRVRDASLADGVVRAGANRGAVLIAGNGHVRRDRGVPDLVRRRLNVPMVAVGLVEVRDGSTKPAQYAAAFGTAELPFDYVVFTPRTSDEDRCNELRRKHGGGSD
jgi:uncharacterized iron-regulated protein